MKNNLTLAQLRLFTAEILAYVVTQIFPNSLLVAGGISETSFYYDFSFSLEPHVDMLPLIEEKMRAIVKSEIPIKMLQMMRENAVTFFEHHHQPLKSQIIDFIQENIIDIIQINDFYDIIPAPLPIITELPGITGLPIANGFSTTIAFKLLSLETTSVHQATLGEIPIIRIEGTAFFSKEDLKHFLKLIKPARKRDHQLLSHKQNIAYTNRTLEEISPGAWLWGPNGTQFREKLLEKWKNWHKEQQFKFVTSPTILPNSLLQQEGIWDQPSLNYLFQINAMTHREMEEQDVMLYSHAPYHALLCKAELKKNQPSLPIRFAECGSLFFAEQEALITGMFRSRVVTADDAYIFCTEEEVLSELISCLQFIMKTVSMLSLKHRYYLNVLGPKNSGMRNIKNQWNIATEWLIQALKETQINFTINNESNSLGMPKSAYRYAERLYGPNIEVCFLDALEREWSGPSLRIDVLHPIRFDLLQKNGTKQTNKVPVMIGRSIFGSLERMIGLLIEHYEGNFPLWLS